MSRTNDNNKLELLSMNRDGGGWCGRKIERFSGGPLKLYLLRE